jgi:hypothetical protein
VGRVGFGEEGSSGGMKAGFIETEGSKGRVLMSDNHSTRERREGRETYNS